MPSATTPLSWGDKFTMKWRRREGSAAKGWVFPEPLNWRSVTGDNDAADWLVMRPPHQLFTIGFNYLLYLNKCHGRVLEVYTYYYYRLRFTNTYLIRLFNSVDKNTNGDYLISA